MKKSNNSSLRKTVQNMFKISIGASILTAFLQCMTKDESCSGCIGPAITIITTNENGDTINPLKIVMRSPDSSKYWIDTSFFKNSIFGNPGFYSLDVLYSDSGVVHLDNIKVNQSSKMTCTHSVMQTIYIKKSAVLSKSNLTPNYEVVSQKTGGGCG